MKIRISMSNGRRSDRAVRTAEAVRRPFAAR